MEIVQETKNRGRQAVPLSGAERNIHIFAMRLTSSTPWLGFLQNENALRRIHTPAPPLTAFGTISNSEWKKCRNSWLI